MERTIIDVVRGKDDCDVTQLALATSGRVAKRVDALNIELSCPPPPPPPPVVTSVSQAPVQDIMHAYAALGVGAAGMATILLSAYFIMWLWRKQKRMRGMPAPTSLDDISAVFNLERYGDPEDDLWVITDSKTEAVLSPEPIKGEKVARKEHKKFRAMILTAKTANLPKMPRKESQDGKLSHPPGEPATADNTVAMRAKLPKSGE